MKYFYVFILLLFINHHIKACSIFYATDENNILAGKNVDWEVPESQIHFSPATTNNYGYVVFNIKYLGITFSTNGGLNDQGLFFDCADNLLPSEVSFHPNGTINYNGDILIKILTSCANVEDVVKLFKIYSTPGFSSCHILVGDSFGNSVVIERGENDSIAFIKSGKNYQIATNFLNSYLNSPKTADFIGDYRYNYIDAMLNDNKVVSVDLFRTILDGAANKGQQDPTIYSTIYNLKSLDVYAYVYSNYEEVLKFNLNDELKKGRQNLSLPDLFSKIKGIYPVSNELITNSSVNLSWYGDVDEYEIFLSTDKEFSSTISFKVESINYKEASLPSLFVLMLVPSLILLRKNKKIFITGIFILIIAGGCKKDLVNLPDTVSTIKHSKTIDGLLPNTTYYWKVVASGKNGYKTESKVYSFITSRF
jgi:hypothetical protein